MTEDGGQRMEDRGWRTEDGGQRMEENGGQSMEMMVEEDGGDWRTEDGGWSSSRWRLLGT